MSADSEPRGRTWPASPCIGVCVLDEDAGLCVGCGRTMFEIANWLKLDEAARAAVFTQLEERLAKLESRDGTRRAGEPHPTK